MQDGLNFSIITAIIPIYAMVFAGWAVRKIGWLEPQSDKSFMRFAIDVSLPCFIFYNMLGNERLRSVEFSLTAISLGAFGIFLCLLIAWIASVFLKLRVGEGQRTFVVTTGVNNYGFFLLALVEILFPDGGADTLGVMLTHNVGCDLVFWSVGLTLISAAGRFSPKILLKGPILSVFVALFFVWTGLAEYIPDFAMTSLKMLGSAAIPLNLIMFGTIMCDLLDFRNFSLKIVGWAVFLRSVFMPSIFIALAYLLPVDPSLKVVVALQSLAPCGVTSAVVAKHFGGHPRIAVQITMGTLVAAVLLAPFWAYLCGKCAGL